MLPLSGAFFLSLALANRPAFDSSLSQTDQRLILWFSIQIFAVVILAQCLQFFRADDDDQ